MVQAARQTSLETHAPIRVEMIRDLARLTALQEAWNGLFATADNASAPLHYDWVRTWWDVNRQTYGDGREALRILAFWREQELVGILPLYQRKPQHVSDGGRRLGFVSTGERERDEICPDYLDLLSHAEVRAACATRAWQMLCTELEESYDRLELSDMADSSILVRWARERGAEFDLEIAPRGVCPMADMTGGFDAYLSRLSSNTRQQGRRLLRAASQAGVVFEVARTPQDAEAFFEEMITLHQQRWEAAGEPGCFASRPFTEFHRRLAARWVPDGRAILSRIRCGEQTLAVKYGFRVGAKYDFYQSGVRMDQGSPIKSPGIVSFLMLMQHLCTNGVSMFDFLRGSSSYKFRLATTAQPLVQVRRVMWTWRTSIGFAADLGGRTARRLVRALASSRKPAHAADETGNEERS